MNRINRIVATAKQPRIAMITLTGMNRINRMAATEGTEDTESVLPHVSRKRGADQSGLGPSRSELLPAQDQSDPTTSSFAERLRQTQGRREGK